MTSETETSIQEFVDRDYRTDSSRRATPTSRPGVADETQLHSHMC